MLRPVETPTREIKKTRRPVGIQSGSRKLWN